jgi:hypothetical protein
MDLGPKNIETNSDNKITPKYIPISFSLTKVMGNNNAALDNRRDKAPAITKA